MKNNKVLSDTYLAELKKTWYWGVYFDWMCNIASSVIEWKGIPEEIDISFVERSFLTNASLLFFHDIEYMFLPYTYNSGLMTVYNLPNSFIVQRPNGYYNNELNIENSVPIFANNMMVPEMFVIETFVARIVNALITLEVQFENLRIPDLITGPKEMQFQIENAYAKRKAGVPAILGTELLNEVQFNKFGHDNSNWYVGDKIQIQMEKIWNEFLTWCGVPNVSQQKKERMVSDEVNRSLGGVIASRNSRLMARNYGAKKVNSMFGLEMEAVYRDGDTFLQDGGEEIERFNDPDKFISHVSDGGKEE